MKHQVQLPVNCTCISAPVIRARSPNVVRQTQENRIPRIYVITAGENVRRIIFDDIDSATVAPF